MVNILTGLFAIALVGVFLGKYALSINDAPLWIIILGTLVLAVDDLVATVRKGNGAPGGRRRVGSAPSRNIR